MLSLQQNSATENELTASADIQPAELPETPSPTPDETQPMTSAAETPPDPVHRGAVKKRAKRPFPAPVRFLYLPLSLLYMEITAKLHLFGTLFDGKFRYLLPLSLAMGLAAAAVSFLLPGKWQRLFDKILLLLATVVFSFHAGYHALFHTFFSWNTLGEAGDAIQFWQDAVRAGWDVRWIILLNFVPFVLLCVFGKKIIPPDTKSSPVPAGLFVCVAASLHMGTLHYIRSFDKDDISSPYYRYTYLQNDLDQTFSYFGIASTSLREAGQLLLGTSQHAGVNLSFFTQNAAAGQYSSDNVSGSDGEPVREYGFHVMDIDFKSAEQSTNDPTLQSMDQYFASLRPTQKNEYTGMFKDKNLIFITLEGFSDKVIDPEFTPLLYKMSHEGFVFQNFYNPMWGGSTSTGEYANLTGNFFTTTNCLGLSSRRYQPMAMGNRFAAAGYRTVAYHNNVSYYYDRQTAHPNFGYEFFAIGNGLELPSSETPNSDKEMAEVTADDYMKSGRKFHAYYMTYSGHMLYSTKQNAMSARHFNELPEKYDVYRHELKSYIACQYEVELMLEVLIHKLEEAGILEDTVIAMNADHYPYGLGDYSLSMLYDLPKENIRDNSQLYRNSFILWCASMQDPIVVEQPCSSIDILPTLYNLFDIEYDSRVLMGTDILSNDEHIAIVKANGWSWITAEGEYIASRNQFIPDEKCTLASDEINDYVKRINYIVNAKTTYSLEMLKKDYYRHIFLQN